MCLKAFSHQDCLLKQVRSPEFNPFPHNDSCWRPWETSLLKTLGKGEIARNEQFLLFPQCFLPIWITFSHFRQIWNCHLQTLLVWKSLKFVVWWWVKTLRTKLSKVFQVLLGNKFFNLLPHNDDFWRTVGKSLLLVTSNFFFSHNVFCPMKDKFNILSIICHLQMMSIWGSLKFCRLVKG